MNLRLALHQAHKHEAGLKADGRSGEQELASAVLSLAIADARRRDPYAMAWWKIERNTMREFWAECLGCDDQELRQLVLERLAKPHKTKWRRRGNPA